MHLPRWLPLARKEARTVLTSTGPWTLAVLLIVWGYRPNYVGWDALGSNMTVGFVQIAGSFLLPLGVLLLSFQSIVTERVSGSLKFLLGLPLTRTDILIGKILGRSIGIAIPVSAAVIVLGLIGLLRFGTFSPILFFGLLITTLFYVFVLVSISTAVSAATASRVRVTSVLFGGVFLLLTVFWKNLAGMVYTNLSGQLLGASNTPADGLFFVLLRVSPDRSYRVLTNWILGVGNSGANYDAVITKLQTTTSVNVHVVEVAFQTESIPIYLHGISGFVVLLLWFVVPIGIVRYHFERSDLV